MTKQDKAPPKKRKKLTKNDLPVLDSAQDLFVAFMNPPVTTGEEKIKRSHREAADLRLNKHGLPVIDTFESQFLAGEPSGSSDPSQNKSDGLEDSDALEENFELLLEASLKQTSGPPKKKPMPMPVKKRLKRYPPPEAELDLHGFTALGAELKAKAFISTCKHQGYFSLRLIVGKGLHSDMGPVLPHVMEDVLKILKNQNIVLAYEWEGQKRAKSGALIVYLKQFND
jgi:DNA-nicking Smr family endonuclease